ncbi:MAG: hypothetical protein AUH92_03720 [Acidobacteria bacterium 13_1_40CM_4_69_4]|nr:MAG: hypothetical protein AUH92_03720 [Acidobacteria bacterium 13_1_40CM_4_69_4]
MRREDLEGLGPWEVLRRLRSLSAAELAFLTDDLDAHDRIWRLQALGAAARAPERYLLDLAGRRVPLSAGRFLARDLPRLGAGVLAAGWALLRAAARVRRLRRAPRRQPVPAVEKRICYLRSDFWSGIPAGGSVGHTIGVAAGLRRTGCEVFFIATGRPVALAAPRSEVHLVPPRRLYNVCRDVPPLAHSLAFERRASAVLSDGRTGLLYQRFDPANHAGVALSRRCGLPFVLEFNGSEVWIADHWGRPLRFRRLYEGIEEVNLRHADLVSVVSDALKEDVLSRGVEPGRVVVLPNAVDPQRYRPDLDGATVRARFGLTDRIVVGFIGTFGVWHGAPVLARAAGRVLRLRPETRFVLERAIFSGLVPQEEGPVHLAAMDILAAPHVPNGDGSRFFGSPTKLFEYMAMGRAIVASRLEQIADVLDHGRTALLVPPGDEEALAAAIVRLIDDGDLRQRLGAAARRQAVERHTWDAHARHLVDRLRSMELVRWS